MRTVLSCVAAIAMVCGAAFGFNAQALDVPAKVHHARSTGPHLAASKTAAHPVHHRTQTSAHVTGAHSTTRSVSSSRGASHVATHVQVRRATLASRRHHYYERFTASSFVTSQGDGDITAGEDPTIRAAAIDALGNMNGTAVVINPANGRILAMVNQHMALSPGAEPCSTIKLSVGLAALSEGLVTRHTPVNLGGFRMNLTEALAHSNNLYFEELGRELGFERVRHYATQFGLGELAGYEISGEQLGTFVAAIANGGTLYYLQHPTSTEDVAAFEPRVKRTLDIARFVPDLQDGMAGAVEYGTARSLRVNFHELPVFGKTGTCSDKGTRFGWFASFSDSPMGSLVTVFFLEGGRPVFGPRAAELTGLFYRSLWDRNYFSDKPVQAVAQNGVPTQKQPETSMGNDLASHVSSGIAH